MLARRRTLAVRAALVLLLIPGLLAMQGCSLLPFGGSEPAPPPPPGSAATTGGVEATAAVNTTKTAEATTTPAAKKNQICDRVTGSELRKAQKNNARVIDTRSNERYSIVHIPDTQNVPMKTLSETAREWNKDKQVIVVSNSAAQGRSAAGYLAEEGFKKACYLEDGIEGWDGDWTGLVDFKHLDDPQVVLIHGGSVSKELDDEWSKIEKDYKDYADFSRHSSSSGQRYGVVALLLGGTPAFVIIYPNGMSEGYSGEQGATAIWGRLDAIRKGKPVPWAPSLEEALERPDPLK